MSDWPDGPPVTSHLLAGLFGGAILSSSTVQGSAYRPRHSGPELVRRIVRQMRGPVDADISTQVQYLRMIPPAALCFTFFDIAEEEVRWGQNQFQNLAIVPNGGLNCFL